MTPLAAWGAMMTGISSNGPFRHVRERDFPMLKGAETFE